MDITITPIDGAAPHTVTTTELADILEGLCNWLDNIEDQIGIVAVLDQMPNNTQGRTMARQVAAALRTQANTPHTTYTVTVDIHTHDPQANLYASHPEVELSIDLWSTMDEDDVHHEVTDAATTWCTRKGVDLDSVEYPYYWGEEIAHIARNQ